MFVLWAVELAESFLEILIVEEKIKIYFLTRPEGQIRQLIILRDIL